jgi:hypothetical protein
VKTHRRVKTLALLVGAMLAQWAVLGPARADSAVGVDTTLGNGLNFAPINPSTATGWLDDEGVGTRHPSARTPTGQFYEAPRVPVENEDMNLSADGWKYFGSVELGGIHVGGDSKRQGFRAYKDLQNGAYLSNFGVSADKPDEARFIEFVGGGVGAGDKFVGLQFGRYNDWRVNVFYNETPHVFTTNYRSLWSGGGTGSLTLNSGLPPGGSASAAATQTSITNVLAGTDTTELSLVRRKAGVRLDMNLSESWKFYAAYSEENRTGSRPFGAVFGGGGGGGDVEIPESIDYSTHDFITGARYTDSANSVNLQASASIFRNNLDTMTFDNPLFVTLNGTTGLTSNGFTQGRFDLVPGNEHYNVKAEYGRALPDFYKGNFTATAALGTMRQDDALIPPSLYSLAGGTVTADGVSLANNWNTTSALSKQSADARIDTRLANLELSLKPTDSLAVKGKLRHYETRNFTEYWACNPLTGEWGRLLNDGTGTALASANVTAGVNPVGTTGAAYNSANCNIDAVRAMNLVPAAGNVNIRNIPFDYKQTNAGLSADYRLDRASSINAALERETFHREYREREKTWEDKLKLGYVNRGAIDGMLRLSFERDSRRGSEYVADPYEPFLSASFGQVPSTSGVNMTSWLHSIDQFRKFDLADRDQNILNARVNYLFRPNLEGALTLQLRDATFPSEYGRIGHQKQNSLTFDLDFRPGETTVVYGFYAYQTGAMEQKGVQANACLMGQTYYFYSNGQVLAPATIGGPAPATPAGATLVATQTVSSANWESLCGAASATSPLYPESRAWDVQSRDRNNVFGLGLKFEIGKAKLDVNFTRALARTNIGYSYNPTALGMNATQVALAGSGFSDLTFAQNILSASLLLPLDKRISLRFIERYESGVIRDWHYDGVAGNPMPANNALYLDAGPQDYRVNLLGVMLQVKI